MKIPFFTNKFQEERYGYKIREKIDEICKKGNFILGEEVKKFEEAISKFTNSKYCIGVANGSDALYLGIYALNIEKGSEIITTPFSFFASSSCIVRNNCIPVFVDIEEDSYNINANLIEEKITDKTKAILPVDLFYQSCEIDKIKNIAKKYNLYIIEDSAEAFGMFYDNKHCGTDVDIGVLSFFPTKTLGCYGDGGMVLTNNEELYNKIKSLRVHGTEKKYIHKYIGINSRLDEIQAGILNVKMEFIQDEIKEREKIKNKYFELLKNVKEIKLPQIKTKSQAVWYVFSIICEDRDRLNKYLNDNGIGTSIYYPLSLHLQECFSFLNYKKGDFPVSEKTTEKCLSLPIFIGMSDDMIEYVCNKIKKFYGVN